MNQTPPRQLICNLKCWQLNPKICLKDFIDFWFNSVRLLNHVKATLSKPFTHGMKSVLSGRIGPMPLLCWCPHLLCDCFRAAKVSDLSGQRGYPHFMVGRMQKQTNKQTNKQNKQKKPLKSIHMAALITSGHAGSCIAHSILSSAGACW